jgi:phospholipase C
MLLSPRCLALLLLVFLIPFESAHSASGPARSANSNSGIQVIQHVIIMVQENRSTDNLFHGLKNAETVNFGINSKGKKITLQPIHLVDNYDLGHLHAAFLVEYDGGKMDGADRVWVSCHVGAKGCVNPQFQYVYEADVDPYFQMAEQYAFADHMFQSNQGASYPAHQFVIGATSAPTATSEMFVAENPLGVVNAPTNTGCTAPPQEFVNLINPLGQEKQIIYPCFEHQTLMDLLDAQQLSWRYYAPLPNQIWTAPNSIKHIRLGSDWQYVINNPKQILNDISGNQLATVSWVMPPTLSSDHPHENNGTGPSWIASVVNAVGNSPYWSSTAIFITWDDWGGWYDHVAPPIINSYQYGLRVPLIIVSPYVIPGCVSHQTHDFSSIVKFTETAFDLPSLGFGDVNADDLTDCFNFSQKALTFHMIKAPLDANYFLNDNSPQPESDEY